MGKKFHLPKPLLSFLSVILGVYLGFYVNQQGAKHKEQQESLLWMQSLINDLSDDIQTYEQYQIPENRLHQENIAKLVELLVADNIAEASKLLSLVFQVENFAPTTSTYTSMKSAGKLSLIEDLTLQKAISNYYEGLATESSRKGEFQADYFTGELLPWLTTNVDLLDMKLLKQDELVILRNKLIVYESLIGQKVTSYTSIVEDSKHLKASLVSMVEAE